MPRTQGKSIVVIGYPILHPQKDLQKIESKVVVAQIDYFGAA